MSTIKKPRLKLEISAVLVIKIIAILILWYACFSHPVDKQLNAKKMQHQLLGTHQPKG